MPFPPETPKGRQRTELDTKLFCNWCGPICGPVTPNRTTQNPTAICFGFLLNYILNTYVFKHCAAVSCKLRSAGPNLATNLISYARPSRTPGTQRNPTEPNRGFCSKPFQGLRTNPEPKPKKFWVPVEISTKPICFEALRACLAQWNFIEPGRCA